MLRWTEVYGGVADEFPTSEALNSDRHAASHSIRIHEPGVCVKAGCLITEHLPKAISSCLPLFTSGPPRAYTRFMKLSQVLRAYRGQPGLWVVSVLTLALGVAAGTSLYGLVRSVYERPFAFLDLNNTVILRAQNEKLGRNRQGLSAPDFLDLKEGARSFTQLAASRSGDVILTGVAGAERIETARVTEDFGNLTSARVVEGRWFLPSDFAPAAPRVTVISHHWWISRFNGRKDIITQTLALRDGAATIIGVAAPEIWFPSTGARLWMPLQLRDGEGSRDIRDLLVLAKVRPGASVQSELDTLSAKLAQAWPTTNAGWHVQALHPFAGLFGANDSTLRILLLALGVAIFSLAMLNVCAAVMSRSFARSRETAIQQALGASRWALLRQSIAEGLVIAVPSVVFGLFASWWLGSILLKMLAYIPYKLPDEPVDFTVVSIACFAAGGAAVLFGLGPALLAGRRIEADLREATSRSITGRRGGRLAAVFVVAQTAVALAIVTAGSFASRAVDLLVYAGRNPGYDARNVAFAIVAPSDGAYWSDGARRRLYARMEEEARNAPGVQAAGTINVIPGFGGDGAVARTELEGAISTTERPSVTVLAASPALASTLRLRIASGRFITSIDDESHPPSALVNEAGARALWGETDPIGKRFRLSTSGDRWWTVIGVYRTLLQDNLAKTPPPQLIVPVAQQPPAEVRIVARFASAPAGFLPGLRTKLQAVAPSEPLRFSTIVESMNESLGGARIFVGVLATLGALSLVFTGVGLFSLLSFYVSDRRREIGIRVALGATASSIARSVYGRGVRLAGLGVLLGIPAAWLVARTIVAMVPTMLRTADPGVLMKTLIAIWLATSLACLVPLRRAMRSDPTELLRGE